MTPAAAARHHHDPVDPTLLGDVLDGLAARPRRISSKYFYDARGSALFEAITRQPEYYLTRVELELLATHMPAIAAAVEEQGAATREIARNIQHAAGGTSEVSSNIVGVSTASAEAGAAAGEVLSASAALRREADVLRSEIDAFLSNIRAA